MCQGYGQLRVENSGKCGKREEAQVSGWFGVAAGRQTIGADATCYAFLRRSKCGASWVRRTGGELNVVNMASKPEILFYDGYCGLCHRAVRFVLAQDREGSLFRFAPLQGETFQRLVTPEQQKTLPDSVVVRTADQKLLARSDAFLHILRRLGGAWRVLAFVSSIVPRALRDFVYDFVARVRYPIFGRRDVLCPVMPPELRRRFDS
jgi:predicted DCC family thiol-disulfide oxidoreductase YuxK